MGEQESYEHVFAGAPVRTYSELAADVERAISLDDADHLQRLATELNEVGTSETMQLAQRACGVACALRGEYSQALEHFHLALAASSEFANAESHATLIGNIGIVYYHTGNHASALESFRKALAIQEHREDKANAAKLVGNIGLVFLETGFYPEALEHFHRALAIHSELGDRANSAKVTANIGIVYNQTGNHTEALSYYRQALALHEELGNRPGIARVTGNIGTAFADSGDFVTALDYYQRALALNEELGDAAGVAVVTGDIIDAYLEQGCDDAAQLLLDKRSSQHLDVPGARYYRDLQHATVEERKGSYDAAASYLQRALDDSQQHGLRSQTAAIHLRLRDLAHKRNDFAGYINHNNEYTRITEEINGKEATQRLAILDADRKVEAERREHEKHRALLHNTLPPTIADRVLRGEEVNDSIDNAAILFMDMVGFTSMSASMNPGQVVALLGQIFSRCDEIVLSHGLTKIKTIGDSYMAAALTGDVALSAASAALELLQMVRSHFPDITVRIGIHCGPVTAGVIGTERLQYDVWGDTVNVASRMESTSEPGRIQVSEAFAEALSPLELERGGTGGAGVSPRGTIDIKGKGMMKTFWLDGSTT